MPEPPDRPETASLRTHLDRDTFYPLPPDTPPFTETTSTRRGLRRTDVRFRSGMRSGDDRVDAARAVLLERDGGPPGRPLVLLHGLGLPALEGWLSFAATLARSGHPTLLVELPHTCSRRVPGERAGSRYVSLEATRALPAYEQAVGDARTALRWLADRRPTEDGGGRKDGVALAGISLGALVAVIAAALEPAFACVVPILGGADLDALVFGGTYGPHMKRRLRRAGISREDRRLARARYMEYLDDVRAAAHPLDVPPAYHYFLFDPLTFATHLRERPALMLNARFDPIIPAAASRQLWLELGCPERSVYWGTHWAGGPWRPYVVGRLTRYLASPRSTGTRRPADTRAV